MMFEPVTTYQRVNIKGKWTEKEVEDIGALTKALYSENIVGKSDIPSIVTQNCACCHSAANVHNSWGVVSSCCGSFFCSQCLDSMTTNTVVLKTDTERTVQDEHHYYCVICHSKDTQYVLNTCRHKQKNIQPYNMISEHFDVDDILNEYNGVKVEYYFKMLMKGLVPVKHNGKAIVSYPEVSIEVTTNEKSDEKSDDKTEDVKSDLTSGLQVKCIKDFNVVNKKIEEIVDGDKDYSTLIPQLFAKDRLGILSFNCIESVLKQLSINPSARTTVTPNILIYNCPESMQFRIKSYFEAFSQDPESPLYKLNILFASSMGELIGLHKNILGIIVWNEPTNIDESRQLIGRILRLNAWCNPLYFYITCKSY
jgi:hypothetical protein